MSENMTETADGRKARPETIPAPEERARELRRDAARLMAGAKDMCALLAAEEMLGEFGTDTIADTAYAVSSAYVRLFEAFGFLTRAAALACPDTRCDCCGEKSPVYNAVRDSQSDDIEYLYCPMCLRDELECGNIALRPGGWATVTAKAGPG